MGIIASSYTYIFGMNVVTGGKILVSISFGVGSYDITNDKLDGIWNWGENSTLENVGYTFGAMANLSDILIGFNLQKVDLVTEHSDATGHIAIVNESSATEKGYGNGNPFNADPNGIISVGPNIYTGVANTWLGGGKDYLSNGLIGALSGFVGGAAGQWAASGAGGVIINGTAIQSSVAKGFVTGVIGGAVGGYAGGFTAGILTTGDLNLANQMGLKGLVMGAAIGGASGIVSVYKSALDNDINPWTGRPNKSVTIGEGMQNRVNPAAKDLGSETLK